MDKKDKYRITNNKSEASFTYNNFCLDPKEQIGLHQQSTWELSYIINGAGLRLIGDIRETFSAGEVVLVPPHIPHCWYFDSNVTDKNGKIANITITFPKELPDEQISLFPEFLEYMRKFNSHTDAIRFSDDITAVITPIMKNMNDENDAERLLSVIRLIMIIAESKNSSVVGKYKKPNKEKERMNQIQTYIICNIRRNLMLDDIARHLGMNRAAFCVFFKKTTGKTFVTYVNELRIEMACELLRENTHNISDICFNIGFCSVPYFNRVFKQVKGITPGEYIEILKT